nr:neurotrypsin-like isoform X2 [Crassostrea virginica]
MVVCKQLGYAWTGAVQKQNAPYGPGTGSFVLDTFNCVGAETSIVRCDHKGPLNNSCSHNEDVGVICFSVRLVGGSYYSEGRVVVTFGDTDGTVCDDNWDHRDARVVCRMLGYRGAAEAFSSAHFGAGTGQIWMDDVHCRDNEVSLAQCSFNGFGAHDCSHGEDAGVRCHH